MTGLSKEERLTIQLLRERIGSLEQRLRDFQVAIDKIDKRLDNAGDEFRKLEHGVTRLEKSVRQK